MKEILRVVNAKRLSVEIGRRFSETVDPSSAMAAAAAAAAAATAGSTAPAPAASAKKSIEVGNKGGRGTGNKRGGSHATGRGNISSAGSMNDGSDVALLGTSSHPFESSNAVGGPGAGKGRGGVEAAAELLTRVRGQLERSERRTNKGAAVGGSSSEIAPPR